MSSEDLNREVSRRVVRACANKVWTEDMRKIYNVSRVGAEWRSSQVVLATASWE